MSLPDSFLHPAKGRSSANRVPTRSDFMRFISTEPPADNPLYLAYCASPRATKQDHWGEWLYNRHRGVFNVLWAKFLNEPASWDRARQVGNQP